MKRLVALLLAALAVAGCHSGPDGEVRAIRESPCVFVQFSVEYRRANPDDDRRHPDGVYCFKNMEQ